uniref:VASt domain-containing protein n=1 Tax=Caenorhabditis tropicalis TaxID=1561998 RepID=A0A1I7TGC9_9PELO
MAGSIIRMIVDQLDQERMRRMVPTFGEEMIVEASHLNIKLAIPASAIHGVGNAFYANVQKIGLLAAEVAYQLQPMAEKMVLGEIMFEWKELSKPQGVIIFHGQAKQGEQGWRIDVYIKTKEEDTPKVIAFGSSSLNPAPSQRTSSKSSAASAEGISAPPPRPSSMSLKRASSSLLMTRDSKILKELEAVAQMEPTSSTRPTSTRPAAPQISDTEQIVKPEPVVDVLPVKERHVEELVKMMAVNVLSHTFTELEAKLRGIGVEPLYVTKEVIPIKMTSRAVFYFQVAAKDIQKMSRIVMRGKEWANMFSIARLENCKEWFIAPAVSMIQIIETFFLSKTVLFEMAKHGTPSADDWTARLQNKKFFQKATVVSRQREDVLSKLNARGRKMYEELKKMSSA